MFNSREVGSKDGTNETKAMKKGAAATAQPMTRSKSRRRVFVSLDNVQRFSYCVSYFLAVHFVLTLYCDPRNVRENWNPTIPPSTPLPPKHLEPWTVKLRAFLRADAAAVSQKSSLHTAIRIQRCFQNSNRQKQTSKMIRSQLPRRKVTAVDAPGK